jgi:3-hydroxybutyryl-CoA dehydrogenase
MSAQPHSQLRVGVIGAGRTGRGIAAAFARAGACVAVFDPDPDPLSVVSLRVALELEALGADPAAARAVFPVDMVRSAAAGADLVFEAAPEDLRTKRGLCATLGLLAPTAIVATATERLPVAEIATATARPGRLLGTHWWDSVAGTGPVEVVAAPRTDPAVAERLEALLEEAGKSVVRLVGDRAHPPTGWATARSAERAP